MTILNGQAIEHWSIRGLGGNDRVEVYSVVGIMFQRYAVKKLSKHSNISAFYLRKSLYSHWSLIGCLHDLANVQQTSSKCIQNTRELLDVCWIV